MKRFVHSCMVLLAALAFGACAEGPAPETTTMVPDLTWDQVDSADGATLYSNLCASCHGTGAEGNGPVAAELTVAVPDLTLLSELNGGKFPLARVEAAIRGPETLAIHGGTQMPVWGPAIEGVFDHLPHVNREAFASSRIRRISRHLESLQTGGG